MPNPGTSSPLLFVEDDKFIADAVMNILAEANYETLLCSTIAQARKALEHGQPCLVILDWNMPDGTGLELCREIRKEDSDLPLLFLTVNDDPKQIAEGLYAGADDYVTKPFHKDVLLARIAALLRRNSPENSSRLICGDIMVDLVRNQAYRNGDPIALSANEYLLLVMLLENKGCILTRSHIIDQLWSQNGTFVNDNTLTVTMKRLRLKLGNPSFLKTIRSFGYRLEDPE